MTIGNISTPNRPVDHSAFEASQPTGLARTADTQVSPDAIETTEQEEALKGVDDWFGEEIDAGRDRFAVAEEAAGYAEKIREGDAYTIQSFARLHESHERLDGITAQPPPFSLKA